jgi:2-haloacid dehalogenase
VTAATAVFDILGTCFPLDQLALSPWTVDLWLARSQRDAMALSEAGGYRPLTDILRAELARTLFEQGFDGADAAVDSTMQSLRRLAPREDLPAAVRRLANAGWSIVALASAPGDLTRALLSSSGLLTFFEHVISCDEVGHFKPHRSVYETAIRRAPGQAWMITAHSWDVMGALRAGMRGAFISNLEGRYLDAYPQPDLIASSLSEAVDEMIAGG